MAEGDGKWYTEEDFDRDFWDMAKSHKYGEAKKAQPTPTPPPPPPPPKLTAPKRKSKIKSIYFDPELNGQEAISAKNEDDDEDEDQVVYCLPSRGRLMNPTLRRPGGKLSDSEFYKEVHSSIREVSGLGYSNELLEHAFKNRDEDDETNTKRIQISPEIQFKPVSNKSGASSAATSPAPSDSSVGHAQDNHCSPLTKPQTDYDLRVNIAL